MEKYVFVIETYSKYYMPGLEEGVFYIRTYVYVIN